jgi:hypothetical protein
MKPWTGLTLNRCKNAHRSSDEGGTTLIPKVVLFERTQPTTIFGQQTTTLEVEWRLKGRTGDTLWVDTIKGESTTKMGSNHKKSAGVQVQAALDRLFSDTFKSMTSSPDLRRFALGGYKP